MVIMSASDCGTGAAQNLILIQYAKVSQSLKCKAFAVGIEDVS